MSNDRWRKLYPFASHTLLVGGHRYHYLDEGQGPTLLLVHGNPTWSFYWRNIVLGLRDRYRLVVVDHIGCGLSDKPGGDRYSYRLAQRIADLRSLVEDLDLRDITLLAHDWGGAIGMGAAAALPDRFARFVLFNTAAYTDTRIPLRIRVCRTPVLGKLGIQGLNLFAWAALSMAVERHERMTSDVKAGLLAPYDGWANRIATYRFVDDIPLAINHPSYATLRGVEEGLAQFRQHPVSLVWGMRDWCFSPHFLERFIEFFPQAEVHRFDDAGHYVIEDAHERIVPLVDEFVRRHRPASG